MALVFGMQDIMGSKDSCEYSKSKISLIVTISFLLGWCFGLLLRIGIFIIWSGFK